MTLRECYEAIGGNYDDVLTRLPDEAFVARFLTRFLDDPSFAQLKESLEQRDSETAFRAAHTLKGVCQNLSLDQLYRSSSALTDLLRDGSFDGADELFTQVAADYESTVAGIRSYTAQ